MTRVAVRDFESAVTESCLSVFKSTLHLSTDWLRKKERESEYRLKLAFKLTAVKWEKNTFGFSLFEIKKKLKFDFVIRMILKCIIIRYNQFQLSIDRKVSFFSPLLSIQGAARRETIGGGTESPARFTSNDCHSRASHQSSEKHTQLVTDILFWSVVYRLTRSRPLNQTDDDDQSSDRCWRIGRLLSFVIFQSKLVLNSKLTHSQTPIISSLDCMWPLLE